MGGTSASFAYLADGTRQSKTAGSTTTDYLYDREAGLPEVVDDGTTSYLRGVGLAAEVDDATGDAVSPLSDGLGSVRARADEAGAVVGTADWDAWGNLRAASGVSGEFGWAGEQRDGETGLTYLRSRYYAPGAARFLTRDTVSPNAAGTQGYDGYAYADGNPVTWTDPSGHGVAGVFAVVARVLECALRGECRYRRQHEATHPTQEAVSGVPSAGHWGGGGGSGGSIGGIVVVCKPRPGRRCGGGVPGGPFGPSVGQPEERPMVDEGGGGGGGVVAGGGGAVDDEGSAVGAEFPSTPSEEGGEAAGAGGLDEAGGTEPSAGWSQPIGGEPIGPGSADFVELFGPGNPGPLRPIVAQSFAGDTYGEWETTQPVQMVRVWGGNSAELGRFLTGIDEIDPLTREQAIRVLALAPDFGNTAENITEFMVPEGTVFYEGRVAPQGDLPGGAWQIFLPDLPSNDWIVSSDKLP